MVFCRYVFAVFTALGPFGATLTLDVLGCGARVVWRLVDVPVDVAVDVLTIISCASRTFSASRRDRAVRFGEAAVRGVPPVPRQTPSPIAPRVDHSSSSTQPTN